MIDKIKLSATVYLPDVPSRLGNCGNCRRHTNFRLFTDKGQPNHIYLHVRTDRTVILPCKAGRTSKKSFVIKPGNEQTKRPVQLSSD